MSSRPESQAPIVDLPVPKFGTVEPEAVHYRPGTVESNCSECGHFLPGAGPDGLPRCKVVHGEVNGTMVCDRYEKDVAVDEWDTAKKRWIERTTEENRVRLYKFRDLYMGKRCFIVGTGPSLDKVPAKYLSALRLEYTWGVNTLLAYPRLPFIPTFYAVAESQWLQGISIPKTIASLRSLPAVRFYAHHWPLENLEDWIYVRYDSGLDMERGMFEGLDNKFEAVTNGRSVISMAVQIACWMGFQHIYLLGVDATQKGHAIGTGLGRWEYDRGRQDAFVRCMDVAAARMKEHGRRLINLSKGGNLTIERGDLKKVL